MIVAFCGHREIQEPETVETWLNEVVESLIFEGAQIVFTSADTDSLMRSRRLS